MNLHKLVACVKFAHSNIFYSSSYMLLGSTLQTVSHNAYHQDPYAQEFGIRISDQLAQVEARILPAPRVSWILSTGYLVALRFPDLLLPEIIGI